MEPDFSEKTFVCFSCMQPNEFENRFCKFCNAPISQYSSNDPLQIAYGEGMAYRKAVEGKPKFVIILGVWMLFFPLLLIAVFIALQTLSEGYGSEGLVMFWLAMITGAFSFVMLFRVTKNYIYFEESKNVELLDD